MEIGLVSNSLSTCNTIVMPDTEICLLRFIGVRVPLSKDRQGPGDLYFFVVFGPILGVLT